MSVQSNTGKRWQKIGVIESGGQDSGRPRNRVVELVALRPAAPRRPREVRPRERVTGRSCQPPAPTFNIPPVSALQSIDTAAFRFINGTLQNPFFDWLMPLLAGGRWFIALVLMMGAVLCWKGGTRGRLCIVMLAITVGLNDGFVCNPIKHAVNRVRPCKTLDNVHKMVGCGGSGSMPSSHASNCTAATVVLWLFYRRSLRIALPIALLVGFSRSYLGAHYPGDVLVGAALGAGSAVAIVFGLNRLWQTIGPRRFPAWFVQLPNLILPGTDTHRSPH